MAITLTAGQEAAYAAVLDLFTSDKQILVIEGFAGTGKTTLIKSILDEWPKMQRLSNGAFKPIDIVLTATTNKAAAAISDATKEEATTIHSYLGLRVVNTGYKQSELKDSGKLIEPNNCIVIDEGSFVDDELLAIILHKAKKNKIIFMGDPCQLKPVGSSTTPVFSAGFPTVKLTEIVRQADTSPIQKASHGLRDYVDGGPMPKIGVDGVNIIHMAPEDFQENLVKDCKNKPGDVRALAWTNATAQYYNSVVAEACGGSPEIRVGDIAVVNKQVVIGNTKLTTDSTIKVMSLNDWAMDSNGIESREVTTSWGIVLTLARYRHEADALIKKYYDAELYKQASILENHYCDLRLMYASTVNKSQGSTYDTVYINLTDIGNCKDKDQVRRMLYVAVSRARNKVVLTGDI